MDTRSPGSSDHQISYDLSRWRGKTIIIAPVQLKVATDVIKYFVLEGIRVIAVTNYMKRAETVRLQLPTELQDNFISIEMDFHSISSMRSTCMLIKRQYKEAHLLMYFVPKPLRDPDQMFRKGQEITLQTHLDVTMESAKAFLRQAQYILFPPCCQGMCNSELLWIVRYSTDSQDNVLKTILKRISSDDMPNTICYPNSDGCSPVEEYKPSLRIVGEYKLRAHWD